MKKRALVIGLNGYEDEEILRLSCSERDADEVWAFLRNQGFEAEVLRSGSATATTVRKAVVAQSAGLGEEDFFLLYFAGHGVVQANEHLLVCHDAFYRGLQNQQGALAVSLLRDLTDHCHRAFILDACRSQLLKSRRTAAETFRGAGACREVVLDEGHRRSACAFGLLTSCDEGKEARELLASGHGLFTTALLELWQRDLASGAGLGLNESFRDRLGERMGELAREHLGEVDQWPFFLSNRRLPELVPGSAAAPVAPPVVPPRQAPPPVPSPTAEVNWHALLGGKVTELRVEQLRERIASGALTGATMVWRSGMEDWLPAGDVGELSGLLATAGPTVPPPPPMPSQEAKAAEKREKKQREKAHPSSVTYTTGLGRRMIEAECDFGFLVSNAKSVYDSEGREMAADLIRKHENSAESALCFIECAKAWKAIDERKGALRCLKRANEASPKGSQIKEIAKLSADFGEK